MAEYQNGTVIPCRATFTDPTTGLNVDPTTVTVTVRQPATSSAPAVTTTYTYGVDVQLERENLGQYRIDLDAETLGTWIVRFESEGTYEGAQEGSFYVY